MDMLEVGNGMSVNEDRAHFSIWVMMASPLIAGNDLRSMSKETAAILTNKAVIAVNQDTSASRRSATRSRTASNTGSNRSPAATGR